MNAPNWEATKHLLAEYDGTATEIFVIGLPISRLPVVIDVIAELPALEVISFDDEVFKLSKPFNDFWYSKLKAIPKNNYWRSLRSACSTHQHLQIYLWLDVHAVDLVVELVFWNDMTFPCGISAEEREQRLKALLELAEGFREGIFGARCILAAEHNGSIKELLELKTVVVW